MCPAAGGRLIMGAHDQQKGYHDRHFVRKASTGLLQTIDVCLKGAQA